MDRSITSSDGIIVETSGSEGQPKPVLLSFAMLRASAALGEVAEKLQAGDRWLNCLPMHHVGGLAIAYRCERAGAAMRLLSRFDPAQLLEILHDEPITHLSLVPVMLSKLLQQAAGRPPPASLKLVLMGGDRLPKAVATQAVEQGWPIAVSYGMTETASRITLLPLNRENIEQWDSSDVGPPLPGVQLTISETGAVVITSPALFPQVPHQHITQDRGWIDERGHLHLQGRLDHQILSGGLLISPLAVEECLLQHPAIDAVGVAGRKDDEWGEVVVAVVTIPITAELEAWIQEQLPSEQRPRALQQVGELQRTANGKIDRKWLREVVNHVE